MEDHRKHEPGSSHAAAWIVSVIAALAIYVLSFGPVAGLCANGTINGSEQNSVANFYSPVLRLARLPGVAPIFKTYIAWWIKVLKKR